MSQVDDSVIQKNIRRWKLEQDKKREKALKLQTLAIQRGETVADIKRRRRLAYLSKHCRFELAEVPIRDGEMKQQKGNK